MSIKFFKRNPKNLFAIFLLTSYFSLLTIITTALAGEMPEPLSGLDPSISQVVLVHGRFDAVPAQVSGWERQDGAWKQVMAPVNAVLGRNGLAPEGEKREGDGRTPSGIFALRRAFGYEANVTTGLEYQPATEKDFWIDAPSSPFYNQWFSNEVAPTVSHEVLRRPDDLYKYAIVIEYNTDPVVPGMGSAIFMHLWRGAGEPTAGCVAMAETDLLRLLRWLDSRRNPVIILTAPLDKP